MTTKHTKGPWTYELSNGEHLRVIAGDETVLGGCGCCGSPFCGEADAKLIAVAPELFEALQYAVKQFPELATVPVIAAAIAKAT